MIDANWTVKPRDYVIYAIKYVNPWHGFYLRRGKDEITGSVSQTIIRHRPFVENDEVNMLTTRSLKVVACPVVYKNQAGNNVNVTLLLTFDDNGTCTISSGTSQVTATGTGKFVSKGEKNSWGAKDRDAIYLDYSVNVPDQSLQARAMDTLVMRDRAVKLETFSPVVK